MSELYLDDVDKVLIQQYKLGQDVYWPKEAQNVVEGHYSAETDLVNHSQVEEPADNNCTLAG